MKILCEIINYEIGDKWTDFILRTSYNRKCIENGKLYNWSDKMYKVREGIRCNCPERIKRRKKYINDNGEIKKEKWHKCEEDWNIKGKNITLIFDGYNWEIIKVQKGKRCKLE